MGRFAPLPRAVLAAVLLAAGCGGSGGPAGPTPNPIPGPGDYDRTLLSGGLQRSYSVHVPTGYAPGASLPVVFAFHGTPSSPDEIRRITDFDRLADERGFVAVYPEAAFGDWGLACPKCPNAADLARVDDPGFVRDVVAHLAADLSIDRGRVFAAGFSNGGLFVFRLACESADLFSGFAAVGASLLDPRFTPECRPARPDRMLLVHGTLDPTFPPQGKAFGDGRDPVLVLPIAETVDTLAARGGCAPDPVVTQVPDVTTDGTTVERWEFTGCSAGAPVVFYRVVGGGHTWPGSPVTFSPALGPKSLDLDASARILDFFLSPNAR